MYHAEKGFYSKLYQAEDNKIQTRKKVIYMANAENTGCPELNVKEEGKCEDPKIKTKILLKH